MPFIKCHFRENLYKQDFHLKLETKKWALNFIKMYSNVT